MSTLTAKTKALGKSLGFDIVGITTADRFARDEQAALQRVNDGLMDGLAWYTQPSASARPTGPQAAGGR